MLIGVFDSGVGGHFVAQRLRTLLPEHTFKIIDDPSHVPYGNRSEPEIIALTEAALQLLLAETLVIILACNTATAVAIDYLRDKYPHHYFIGFEPMVKPLSAMTHRGVILATQATLRSSRYAALKKRYDPHNTIQTPTTLEWARHIENGNSDAIDYHELDTLVQNGADVIALSCTHYFKIEDYLRDRYAGRVTIIEPTSAIADRLRTVIEILQPR